MDCSVLVFGNSRYLVLFFLDDRIAVVGSEGTLRADQGVRQRNQL